MNKYSFTLVKTSNPVFISDYESQLASIQKLYPRSIMNSHFERGLLGRLHIHGLVENPSRMYINKIHPGKGWNLDFKLLGPQDVTPWSRYIIKDISKETRLINEELNLEREFLEFCNRV